MKEKKVYNVEQEANEEKIDFQEILKGRFRGDIALSVLKHAD